MRYNEEKGFVMKYAPYIAIAVGFILLVGTAGSIDFYDECRAAADCVAGEPMSYVQMLVQSLIGIVLFGIGVFSLVERDR